LLLAVTPLTLLMNCPGQCDFVPPPADLIAAPTEVDDDVCRIPQANREFGTYRGEYSTAFPFERENIMPDQEVSLLVVPIDWSNHRGTAENLKREFEQVQIFTDLYTTMSEGRLTFRTSYGGGGTKWLRLPEPIENYPQEWTSDFNSKVAQHAIDAIDPEVDFSTIDLMILVFPDNPPIPTTKHLEFGFASMQHFNRGGSPQDPRNVFSDEGWVRNYVGGAGFFDHPARPVWSYYVHEVAHTLRIPDWYMREANLGANFIPGLDYAVGPMNYWDAMSSQDGPSRTFSAWTRWLVGWLGDEQIACFELDQVEQHGAFDVELVPLDVYEPGVKAVLIRTGPHAGLVIESRRPVFPDHDLAHWRKFGREPSGLVVYRVDATKGNNSGTLVLVPPKGQGVVRLQLSERMDPRVIDALYNVGAEGFAEGLKIELVRSGTRDIVRISPAS
jgi:M6 family metalloprotease-like protein